MLLREVQLPGEEGLQKVGIIGKIGNKKCFYFHSWLLGKLQLCGDKGCQQEFTLPLGHDSAAHQHKPFSPEHMRLSWDKVQLKGTAQGTETPFKVWEVESESCITLQRAGQESAQE